MTRVLLIICLVCLGFSAFPQNFDPKTTDQKLVSALMAIRYGYVDTVNEPKLVENAIVSMLRELDPHSVYISKKDVEKTNEPLVGNFEGVGISFQLYNDTIMVIAPIPEGPAERAGILAGDKMVKIEGADATGKKIDNNWIFERLRGKKGSPVTVSILRKGKKDLIDYTIIRDKIPINSIDATFMARPGIGYIKLNRFSNTTMDEFMQSIKKLKLEGLKSLILDLRGNSGGFMNPAIDLADEFLGADKMIVYTEGLKSPVQRFNATSSGNFEKGKLIVMIDEGSASSSEILAGAIQDWDRGVIIGRRSFGKGLVQKPFNLPDGSMMRLTTARYHTPTGRCIQKPYNEGLDNYYKDFANRIKHGELINPDSVHFPDSLKFYTPNHRLVYGGGGIMPDVFIPWDSTRFSDYYTELVRKGVFTKFPLQYIDEKRTGLMAQYPDFKTFKKNFVVTDTILNEFFKLADSEGVKKDETGYLTSEPYIKLQLKALVARNLFNLGCYFEIISEMDDGLNKAVEVMEDNTMFKKLKVQY